MYSYLLVWLIIVYVNNFPTLPHPTTPSWDHPHFFESWTACAGLPSCTGGLFAQLGFWDPSESPGHPLMLTTDTPGWGCCASPPTLWMPTLFNSTKSFKTELFRKKRERKTVKGEGRGMVVKRRRGTGRRTSFLKKISFPPSQLFICIAIDASHRCFKICISETAHISSLVKNLLS